MSRTRIAAIPLSLFLLMPLPVFPADIPGNYSLLKLPVLAGMERTAGGAVLVNTVSARWFVFSGGEAERCRMEASRLGWRAVDEFFAVLPSQSGGITMTGYRRRGDARMLVLVLPDSGTGPVVMAILESPIELSASGGEAPGREPAGVPRVASARRLLHLSGGRIEASFYSSPAGPAEVLSSARRILGSRGWHTSTGNPGILLASRERGPDLAYFAREAPGGSRYLVFAARRTN